MGAEKTRKILFILVVLILHLFFIFHIKPIPQADTPGYDNAAWNLVQGNGYSSSKSPPFFPSMHRPPTYPLFLAIIYKLFGHNYFMVIIFQHILLGLIAIITYFLGQEFYGHKKTSFLPAGIILLHPIFAYYSNSILTEILFTFLLSAGILCLVKAIKKESYKFFIFSGFFLGSAVLCRPIAQLLFLIILLFLIYYFKSFKKSALYFLTFFIPMVLIITPWVIRNWTEFNFLGVSPLLAQNLFIRTSELIDSQDHNKSSLLFLFKDSMTETETKHPELLKELTDASQRMGATSLFIAKLNKKGFSASKIRNKLLGVSFELILLHPYKYVSKTAKEIAKFWAGYGIGRFFKGNVLKNLLLNFQDEEYFIFGIKIITRVVIGSVR